MIKILFVCTGNTCRSSMAGAIARDLVQKKGWSEEQVMVLSAGLAAVPGAPAAPEAVKAMEEQGLDLKEHRARSITPQLVEEADLILAMTRDHKRRLLAQFPQHRSKIYTLAEYAGEEDYVRLAKKAEELSALVEEKEQRFIASHREELDRLRQEYQDLCRRLSRVEQELASWEDRIRQESAAERQELARLDQELRERDIADPIGGTLEDYRQCSRELSSAIEKVLDKLAMD